MLIEIIKPSGFCYGVKRALNIVDALIKNEQTPKPIYIYGMLIHNKNVINDLEKNGVVSLERDPDLLNTITGTIVFSAHGSNNALLDHAKGLGLNVVDATCPDVLKTHKIIMNNLDKDIAYIGIEDHAESDAAKQFPNVTIIDKPSDLDKFHKKTLLLSQTTMSILDNQPIYDYAKTKNNIEIVNEVCPATRHRQEALLNSKKYDIIFIVGDRFSNNSNTLANLLSESYLIETYHDIKESQLKNVKSVGISAGASTSDKDIQDVYNYLINYKKN